MSGTVLVTGSSQGIGAAIAARLARDGYDIVLHCRSNRRAAEAVAESIRAAGRAARILQFDVTDREACARVLTQDIDEHAAYYGVVCNAGLTRDAVFPALSPEAWDQVLGANLDAFYNVLQPVTLPMIRRRAPGRIVTLASVSGLVGNRGQVNYSAAKAGLIGATKALAIELASREITVNCVAPGLIDTGLSRESEAYEAILHAIPMARAGRAEEVAAVVSFLMSADSAYVTRQVIAVNGGLC